MIPKSVFESVGMFVPGCVRAQDIDMWYRIMAIYPAIIIGKETTIYHREDSTATIKMTKNFDWPFFDTADRLIKEKQVSNEVANSLNDFTDDLRLSMAFHMTMWNEKKKAKKMFRSIKNPKRNIKKRMIIKVLFLLPASLIKKLYYFRNRNWIS